MMKMRCMKKSFMGLFPNGVGIEGIQSVNDMTDFGEKYVRTFSIEIFSCATNFQIQSAKKVCDPCDTTMAKWFHNDTTYSPCSSMYTLKILKS